MRGAVGTAISFVNMFVGFSDFAYNGALLPIDLAPLGPDFNRAADFVSLDMTLGGSPVAGQSGTFRASIAVPNQPSFLGMVAFAQWGLLDNTTFCHSNALMSTPMQ